MAINKALSKTIFTVAFTVLVIYVASILVRIFFFDIFIVEGNSMLPTLRSGNLVCVNKTIIGARIYIPNNLKKHEYLYFRTRGQRNLEPGDIAIFNFPCTEKNKLIFDSKNHLIKRCIGCPGDSIAIRNGYYVNTNHMFTGIPETAQKSLSCIDKTVLTDTGDIFLEYCIDPRWDIKDFGPIYIPGRGDTITLSLDNLNIYKTIIEYETGDCPNIEDTGRTHIFNKDYYFFAGDNVFMSKDSRHFGLVPKDFIVGVVLKKT